MHPKVDPVCRFRLDDPLDEQAFAIAPRMFFKRSVGHILRMWTVCIHIYTHINLKHPIWFQEVKKHPIWSILSASSAFLQLSSLKNAGHCGRSWSSRQNMPGMFWCGSFVYNEFRHIFSTNRTVTETSCSRWEQPRHAPSVIQNDASLGPAP